MESASLALWATQQVFRTPELLQLILLQTDLSTLLTVAQRVCKNWHHTINSTPAIQRALYFLPEIRPEFVPEEEPLPPPRHSAERVTVPLEAQPRSHLRPNPLLAALFPAWFHTESPFAVSRYESRGGCHGREPFEQCAVSRNRRGFLNPKASWRRMLITQPPIRKLGLFYRWNTVTVRSVYTEVWQFNGEHGDPQLWDDSNDKAGSSQRHPQRSGLSKYRSQVSVLQRAIPFEEPTGDRVDGVRMGTIYDIPQWLSIGDDSSSCWRVLWTFPSDPQDLVAPGATDDAFLYGENAEQARLMLSDLFDQVDGPVIQISRWQGYDDETNAGDIKFQLRFSFPAGSGLKYAQYWSGVYGNLDIMTGYTLQDIKALDKELDETDASCPITSEE